MDLTEPLTLPAAPSPARRPPIPKLAALVPVLGGIALWAVTGSILALCFAAFGPLMMIASAVDGARQRRREQKRAEADAEEQWRRADAALAQRHAAVREGLRRRHPDLRDCLAETPLSESGFGAGTPLVVGHGEVPCAIRVTGGAGERADRFRTRAAVLAEAPVVVPLGGGVCIRGPIPVASAVARALLVQLCARFRPGQLALTGEGVSELQLALLPHAQPRRRSAARLAVGVGGLPGASADALLCVLAPRSEIPEGVTTVIDCAGPDRVHVRGGEGTRSAVPEALSAMQALRIAERWAEGASADAALLDTLALAEIAERREAAGLSAVFARGESGDLSADLVADGPHAIVTGMTGAGKSELLISWVLSLAGAYGPEEVNFVLADFKGGTAFDPLRELPHVAAVITDLDEEGAERGVRSLRAELRRREEVLAAGGARDIADPAIAMPRLVIVVDEFAALLHAHAELGEVFTDIAARGRALGMHLILGTQRAAGVIREALAANCPLRISLRVADAADSRALLGVADAAELPGDAAFRGIAIARRPADQMPQLVRIALSGAADLARIRERWRGAPPARSPWLPALPARLSLEDLRAEEPDALLLGLADHPDRQRQTPVALRRGHDRGIAAFGGPQSGKSGLLALLAAQEPDTTIVGPDPEAAWDAVARLEDGSVPPPSLLVIDDLDALIGAYPPDYAQAFAERTERIVRQLTIAGACVAVTAGRATGPVMRIADQLPRRALLALPSRADHLAAGGSADAFLARRLPGRARLDGCEVQFAEAPRPLGAASVAVPPWTPAALTALVVAQPARLAADLRERHPHVQVLQPPEAPLVSGPGENGPAPVPGESPVRIVVGDAESWQRHWALWQQLRATADILVSTECAVELRTLLGVRELPPYARAHAGRAWLFRAGGSGERVLLSAQGRAWR